MQMSNEVEPNRVASMMSTQLAYIRKMKRPCSHTEYALVSTTVSEMAIHKLARLLPFAANLTVNRPCIAQIMFFTQLYII